MFFPMKNTGKPFYNNKNKGDNSRSNYLQNCVVICNFLHLNGTTY